MLTLAHTGITVGAAWLLKSGLTRRQMPSATSRDCTRAISPRSPHHSSGMIMHYRLVMVGAMLPDLIDKPIGVFLAALAHDTMQAV